MSQEIQVLALPFLACIILTAIHVYLGIHVISRKVIFVDVALAQIAALGATVAFLIGWDPRSFGAYWFSLSFAVLAAAIFALTRTRHEHVPQEAIIGLTYAVASATAILLADISPHGAEHLKDLLAGSIVWVTPHQIIQTGILYAFIGAFHYIFRKRFLQISLDPERAYAEGVHVRLWDFIFYLSFGVVITSAVQIAGVLLVFCYLVAPAVFAVMFSENLRTRLFLGWSVATVASAVGLLFSYDRPSGPTIMVCLALALILGGIGRAIAFSPNRFRAAALATACAALVILIGFAVSWLGPASREALHQHAGVEAAGSDDDAPRRESEAHEIGTSVQDLRLALSDSHPNVRVKAVEGLASLADGAAVGDIGGALQDPSEAVRENAARTLGSLGDTAALPPLKEAMGRHEEDEWVKLRVAEAVALLGDPAGIPALLELARAADARVVRVNALLAVMRLAGLADKTPADLDDAAEESSLRALQQWWRDRGPSLRWDAASKTFLPHAAI